jgi:alcohol dehydrogenase class IV
LPVELDRMGMARAMIVSTPGRASLADRVRTIAGSRIVGSFEHAAPHVPEDIARTARAFAADCGAQVIIALGGGSAIGVAKAIALESPLPIVAVASTYGGSEMTPIWGMTQSGRKETGRNPAVQPKVVIYDPELTVGLSVRTTGSSGLNAMAHCIEALYAADASPLTTVAACEGLRLLSDALPALALAPQDIDERSRALRGAWLAGFALGTVQMALHHKLCHTLGGAFNLEHAATHAVLLPYTAAYNRSAPGMTLAGQALGVVDVPSGLLSISKKLGTPLSLAAIGMSEEHLDVAADLAVERPYPNPVPVTRDGISRLLTAAFRGDAGYITSVS